MSLSAVYFEEPGTRGNFLLNVDGAIGIGGFKTNRMDKQKSKGTENAICFTYRMFRSVIMFALIMNVLECISSILSTEMRILSELYFRANAGTNTV